MDFKITLFNEYFSLSTLKNIYGKGFSLDIGENFIVTFYNMLINNYKSLTEAEFSQPD